MTEMLLLWLVAYAGIFAVAGFGLSIIKGFARPSWTYVGILRASSIIAFVVATGFWLLSLFAG